MQAVQWAVSLAVKLSVTNRYAPTGTSPFLMIVAANVFRIVWLRSVRHAPIPKLAWMYLVNAARVVSQVDST